MQGTRAIALCTLLALFAGGLLWTWAPEASAGPSRKDVALSNALKTRRLTNVQFEDLSLQDLVKWLRVATGHNYLLKLKPIVKAGIDPEDVRITVTLEDVTVATLLKLVLEPYDLTVVVKGNVVWITTHAASLGRPVTRIY